jgi:hypothetical protein
VLIAAVSLVIRFGRASGAERQQIKWLLYAVLIVVLGYPLVGVALDATGSSSELAADAAIGALLICIPAAVGIAILKHRLYDIDRLINRTLVYGLLTALLGGVYTGLVLVLGQRFGGIGTQTPTWAVAGATLAVAALFQPTRRRIQHAVDRRFNRRRYDAAKTVEAFSIRLRDQIDLDTLSTELLTVVDQTVEPTRVSLWLQPSAHASSGTPASKARPTPWAY